MMRGRSDLARNIPLGRLRASEGRARRGRLHDDRDGEGNDDQRERTRVVRLFQPRDLIDPDTDEPRARQRGQLGGDDQQEDRQDEAPVWAEQVGQQPPGPAPEQRAGEAPAARSPLPARRRYRARPGLGPCSSTRSCRQSGGLVGGSGECRTSQPVQPGASCNIYVEFSPDETGQASGSLTVTTDSLDGTPPPVSLSGTGTPACNGPDCCPPTGCCPPPCCPPPSGKVSGDICPPTGSLLPKGELSPLQEGPLSAYLHPAPGAFLNN